MRTSLAFEFLVGVSICFESIDINHEFSFSHKEVVIQLIEKFEFESIYIHFRDSPDLGVILVLIEEVIRELSRHHHRRYQQPAYTPSYLWTQYWFSTKPYSDSCSRSI